MAGKSKPRDVTKQETREALIRAGMAAFTEEGVDLPSLDGICARAGFTRGAFYVHFKDRDDFFAAVAAQALQDFLNWVLSTGDEQGGLRGVAERFLSALEQRQHSVGDAHKLMMQIVARGSQRVGEGALPYQALIRGAIERLCEAVRTGQQHGVVRSELDPEQLGLLLASAATGFIVLIGGGYEPDYAQVRALVSRWLFSADR